MTRTNAAGILTVFVRACALYIVAMTTLTLPTVLGLKHESGVTLVYGPPLVTFGIAAAFWIFADLIAKLALARGDQPMFESELDVGQWQRVAFSAIGVVFAAGGVVQLLSAVMTKVFFGAALPEGVVSSSAVVAGMKIVVGVGLLIGARGLVGFIERLRGRDSQP